MDVRQLRYFVQIVESGSLAKASRQLFIAQPALSQQMAKLEEAVGKPLLTRSARGVEPTENGVALYHHAKFLLRQFDQTIQIARQEAAQVRGRVSIGLAPTTVRVLGLPLLRHLREKYPGIVLNIIEGLSGHIEHMTRMGQLDMSVLFSQTAASELDVEPLLDEELFVIALAKCKWIPANAKTLSLQEVAALPLILPSEGHSLRRRIVLEFERRGLALQPVAEIDSLPLVMSCVEEGTGVTIKPMSALYSVRDHARYWRALPISDASMTRRNFLYSLGPDKLSPCAALVRHEVKAVIRQLVTDGQWKGVTLAFGPADEAKASGLTKDAEAA
ncbi:LysR substrate-binding domain-containing protein [Burkholderia ambifaria]|uniref:LysR substrate-binding domain-containing protein n=1 Tax=Burkholderia ambifaria TaxID=152480 RepID=UPI001B9BDB07|nr:LysR substrate-binding domain-containing protein [Burkholderia ambifaria]MBR8257573.1 LysR family transcriptional regulator [Burkholderia ambifaria]